MIIVGFLINWTWIIISVYYQKKYNTLKILKVPLSHKSGIVSKKIIAIIGDCIIRRSNNINRFKLELYNAIDGRLIFVIMSKQYYPQIDCNANLCFQ